MQSAKVRAIGWATAKSDAVRCFNVWGLFLKDRNQVSDMPTIETVVFRTPQYFRSFFLKTPIKKVLFEKNICFWCVRLFKIKKVVLQNKCQLK